MASDGILQSFMVKKKELEDSPSCRVQVSLITLLYTGTGETAGGTAARIPVRTSSLRRCETRPKKGAVESHTRRHKPEVMSGVKGCEGEIRSKAASHRKRKQKAGVLEVSWLESHEKKKKNNKNYGRPHEFLIKYSIISKN